MQNKLLVCLSFLLLSCQSVQSNDTNIVKFDSCSISIPNEYELTVNSEHRKSYMNLSSRSSIRVSKFTIIDAPDRELRKVKGVNELIYEEYHLFEKMHVFDQSFQEIYRIHDHRTAISLLNVDKKFVIGLMEACQ